MLREDDAKALVAAKLDRLSRSMIDFRKAEGKGTRSDQAEQSR